VKPKLEKQEAAAVQKKLRVGRGTLIFALLYYITTLFFFYLFISTT